MVLVTSNSGSGAPPKCARNISQLLRGAGVSLDSVSTDDFLVFSPIRRVLQPQHQVMEGQVSEPKVDDICTALASLNLQPIDNGEHIWWEVRDPAKFHMHRRYRRVGDRPTLLNLMKH